MSAHRHVSSRLGQATGPMLAMIPMLILAYGLGQAAAAAETEPPILLKIVGGLAGVSQYSRYEAPFWTQQVPILTTGRVRAEIASFDRSGIRGEEMLPLIRLGVVPFGTVLLALAAGDEPELNGMDLPMLNPDIATLRQSVQLLRPHLTQLLRDRFQVELLAIYAYPAQVVFCRRPFVSLADLRGRNIRVSSGSQGELVEALGGTPVVIAFAGIMGAMRDRVVECAITGSLSGHALGLHAVTSHVSRQAISWGVSVFAVNRGAWQALPADLRAKLQAGLAGLQETIWQAAAQETEEGFACNAGHPSCTQGTPGQMVVVAEAPGDRAHRDRLLRDTVLPGWIGRCGAACAETWNRVMAPTRGILAHME